jgi:S1-C subfamily serine protease
MPFLVVLAAALGLAVQGQERPAERDGHALSRAVARVGPSVVRVELRSGRPLGDAPRRRFFRAVPNRREASGLVVGRRRVLTHAALALYEEPEFEIVTSSGLRTGARLWRLDRERELALLETEAFLDVPAAPLGRSDDLRVGSLVLALGDPFGMARDAQAAASLGVLEGRVRLDARETSYTGEVLLTDAAVNPGNEGGPLVDVRGRVVGLLAPLARDRRLASPLGALGPTSLSGHAIPIEEAFELLGEAEATPRRVALGFRGRARNGGVEVVRVYPGGPAARAGLREGDVIRGMDGVSVRTGDDLRRLLREATRSVILEIERSGRSRTVEVRLGGDE